MIDKFFLALDYETPKDVMTKGSDAVNYVSKRYGRDFVEELLGVKINQDQLTGPIDKRYKTFKTEKDCNIFADMKIGHGTGTGRKIIKRLCGYLPMEYVTVSAGLGTDILKEYVKIGNEFGVKIITYTIHTKTSSADAERMHNQPLGDAMFNFVQVASEAGCDAAVMEAKMLQDERIRNLPIKKLVTGIRIDPSDKGAQKRVSSVEELANLIPHVHYVVISSKYVGDFKKLEEMLNLLR